MLWLSTWFVINNFCTLWHCFCYSLLSSYMCNFDPSTHMIYCSVYSFKTGLDKLAPAASSQGQLARRTTVSKTEERRRMDGGKGWHVGPDVSEWSESVIVGDFGPYGNTDACTWAWEHQIHIKWHISEKIRIVMASFKIDELEYQRTCKIVMEWIQLTHKN